MPPLYTLRFGHNPLWINTSPPRGGQEWKCGAGSDLDSSELIRGFGAQCPMNADADSSSHRVPQSPSPAGPKNKMAFRVVIASVLAGCL